MPNKISVTVLENRQITHDSFVIRFERKAFAFTAGQYLVVSFPNEREAREYSIYSGENDLYLEILIKSVPEGSFSHRLSGVKVGDGLEIDGPFGFFVLKPDEIKSANYIFIATGTGISPFASYLRSHQTINYELWHGIATALDQIEPRFYDSGKLKYCISREKTSHFHGRVTTFLTSQVINKESLYYLCGNSAMIHDITDILEQNGVPNENIRTEAFY